MAEVLIYSGGALVPGGSPPREMSSSGILCTNNAVDEPWAIGMLGDGARPDPAPTVAGAPGWKLDFTAGAQHAMVAMCTGPSPFSPCLIAAFGYSEPSLLPVIMIGAFDREGQTFDGFVNPAAGTLVMGTISGTLSLSFEAAGLFLKDEGGANLATVSAATIAALFTGLLYNDGVTPVDYDWSKLYPYAVTAKTGAPSAQPITHDALSLAAFQEDAYAGDSAMVAFTYDYEGGGTVPTAFWQKLVGCEERL